MSINTAEILAAATAAHSRASDDPAPVEGASAQPETETGGETEADGLSWAETLKTAPPEMQKLLRSMQADYTRKTQTLAEERKALRSEREALAKGRSGLKPPAEMPAWDPWSEASVDARIEAEVRKRLQEALEPVEASYKEAQATSAYNSFVAENPDLVSNKDLRAEVGAMLQKNENLDLETAYWAVKGRMAKTQAATKQTVETATKTAHKQAALMTGAPRQAATFSRPKASDLKKMSTDDILALAKQMASR
jgi:CRISPR/Cas system CMR-associated protein Cmr5 small subunit